MSQNKSHAVMSQRFESADSLDFFPTPAWATRALCEKINEWEDSEINTLTVWEPACGQHHMLRPLREYFGTAFGTDIHPYNGGHEIQDFLWFIKNKGAHWIITNPPFRHGAQFAELMIERCLNGAAILVRTQFLESAARFDTLFSKNPPTEILQFVERVPMVKGRVDREASTATSYCWIVWRKGHYHPPIFRWISPCRKRLEREGDYA